MPYASVNFANGSLVAELVETILSGNGGSEGLADTMVSPFNMGWHFSRLDLQAGYAFVAPTGRYTFGASDNVGSGYCGNMITSGVTFYVTKNKGTSANVYIDWEAHGKKSGTNITPGQAVTMEWGLGQALPLAKDLSKIAQIGLVGYDQWQVTDNSGITRLLPYYSAHALGAQGNFIVPKHGLNFFFKYYGEFSAKAHPQGRTFGSHWAQIEVITRHPNQQ